MGVFAGFTRKTPLSLPPITGDPNEPLNCDLDNLINVVK
jgi:hypothetical protein